MRAWCAKFIRQETKDGIEWEMVNAAPEPYEEETTKTKLVWGKSSDEEINEVALKVAAGEALKNALKEAVHAAVDPKIEVRCVFIIIFFFLAMSRHLK
jgi:hypothetical protein